MPGQLSRQVHPNISSLNLPGGDGSPLVVVCQPADLSSNPFEQVIHKRIHDVDDFGDDTSVRMHLLQHLVDVVFLREKKNFPFQICHDQPMFSEFLKLKSWQ